MQYKSAAQLIDSVNGLTLLGEYAYQQEMQSVWAAIVSYAATPCKIIPWDNNFLWSDLVSQWNQLFIDVKLLNESNELLVSVGGFAASGVWQKVNCDQPAALLNISTTENEPELIVMDMDRKIFIAITCEEDEFLLFAAHKNNEHWVLMEGH